MAQIKVSRGHSMYSQQPKMEAWEKGKRAIENQRGFNTETESRNKLPHSICEQPNDPLRAVC